MNATVNRRLLHTTTFDSGALGLLAMVLHQFREVGQHHVVVLHQGRHVTELDFEVSERSAVMQLDIDLAAAAQRAQARPGTSARPREKQPLNVVSPAGYVLFYASSGQGYSATVATKEHAVEFTSTRLQRGDLFAVTLLEPGTYVMTNKLGTAHGELVVTITPETAKTIRTLDPQYVEVNEQQFTASRLAVISSQGVVFRLTGAGHLFIEKKKTQAQEPMPS